MNCSFNTMVLWALDAFLSVASIDHLQDYIFLYIQNMLKDFFFYFFPSLKKQKQTLNQNNDDDNNKPSNFGQPESNC